MHSYHDNHTQNQRPHRRQHNQHYRAQPQPQQYQNHSVYNTPPNRPAERRPKSGVKQKGGGSRNSTRIVPSYRGSANAAVQHHQKRRPVMERRYSAPYASSAPGTPPTPASNHSISPESSAIVTTTSHPSSHSHSHNNRYSSHGSGTPPRMNGYTHQSNPDGPSMGIVVQPTHPYHNPNYPLSLQRGVFSAGSTASVGSNSTQTSSVLNPQLSTSPSILSPVTNPTPAHSTRSSIDSFQGNTVNSDFSSEERKPNFVTPSINHNLAVYNIHNSIPHLVNDASNRSNYQSHYQSTATSVASISAACTPLTSAEPTPTRTPRGNEFNPTSQFDTYRYVQQYILENRVELDRNREDEFGAPQLTASPTNSSVYSSSSSGGHSLDASGQSTPAQHGVHISIGDHMRAYANRQRKSRHGHKQRDSPTDGDSITPGDTPTVDRGPISIPLVSPPLSSGCRTPWDDLDDLDDMDALAGEEDFIGLDGQVDVLEEDEVIIGASSVFPHRLDSVATANASATTTDSTVTSGTGAANAAATSIANLLLGETSSATVDRNKLNLGQLHRNSFQIDRARNSRKNLETSNSNPISLPTQDEDSEEAMDDGILPQGTHMSARPSYEQDCPPPLMNLTPETSPSASHRCPIISEEDTSIHTDDTYDTSMHSSLSRITERDTIGPSGVVLHNLTGETIGAALRLANNTADDDDSDLEIVAMDSDDGDDEEDDSEGEQENFAKVPSLPPRSLSFPGFGHDPSITGSATGAVAAAQAVKPATTVAELSTRIDTPRPSIIAQRKADVIKHAVTPPTTSSAPAPPPGFPPLTQVHSATYTAVMHPASAREERSLTEASASSQSMGTRDEDDKSLVIVEMMDENDSHVSIAEPNHEHRYTAHKIAKSAPPPKTDLPSIHMSAQPCVNTTKVAPAIAAAAAMDESLLLQTEDDSKLDLDEGLSLSALPKGGVEAVDAPKCPFLSNRLLFLDVDGVLLTLDQQNAMKKHANHIDTNEDDGSATDATTNGDTTGDNNTVVPPEPSPPTVAAVASTPRTTTAPVLVSTGDRVAVADAEITVDESDAASANPVEEDVEFGKRRENMMRTIYDKTRCDVVVSSSWQFYPEHLNKLKEFLNICGWSNNQIHRLVDLLPEDEFDKEVYEQPPYCRSRSEGVVRVVERYHHCVDFWAVVDDLPLDSSTSVCLPHRDDFNDVVQQLTEAYFAPLVCWHAHVYQLLPHIQQAVQHSLTAPANSLFSWRSRLFGFELKEQNIYVQALTICYYVPFTQWFSHDSNLYKQVLQNCMQVLQSYGERHSALQGLPEIKSHCVKTHQSVGMTYPNLDRILDLLTLGTQEEYTSNYNSSTNNSNAPSVAHSVASDKDITTNDTAALAETDLSS